MTILDPGTATGSASLAAPRPGRLTLPGTLTASRPKITTILDAAELNADRAPQDKQRITLRIRLPDRTITTEIAAKSLYKATVLLQGYLIAGDMIAEANHSASSKASNQAPRSEARKSIMGRRRSVWRRRRRLHTRAGDL